MNIRRLERYTEIAAALSRRINRPNRHISMVFHHNRVVAVGMNRVDHTHTLAKEYGYLFDNVHSELDAFAQIRWMDNKKLTLINWQFNSQEIIKMARPCRLCEPWVTKIFRNIYFTTGNGNEFEKL